MANDSQKQTRSVLAVGGVVIVIALAGTLGFALLGRDTTQKASETTQPISDQSQVYETSTYSFQPPKDGWALSETKYDTGSNDGIVPTAKTTSGVGIEAEVSVYVTATTQKLAELKNEIVTGGDAQNVLDTEVGGVPAFSYISSFEGMRYHTVFIKGNFVYDIIYRYSDDAQRDKYIDGYNDIVSSFSFK